ncbi:MAG: 4'-phosphopantetheinyl transferase superfamily protein [Gemmatimonadaceae bacterium]|nr:4'-phosphopantetheinyl transferase superfamily protein [Gemmatimonadaceae bacterium]
MVIPPAPGAPVSPHGAAGDAVALTAEPFVPSGVFASIEIGSITAEHGNTRAPIDAHGLHEAERALAESLPSLLSAGFVAGRRALRAALQQVAPNEVIGPLLRTARGAPTLPFGLTGSISHKRARAIAVAAPSAGTVLGVDLEERPLDVDLTRPSIATRILTDIERARIEGLDALAHREATLVHFALKEAVYKAIDPYVQRYVRFTEVELEIGAHGTAQVRLLLPEPIMRDVRIDAQWRFDGRWIIALAQSHHPL